MNGGQCERCDELVDELWPVVMPTPDGDAEEWRVCADCEVDLVDAKTEVEESGRGS